MKTPKCFLIGAAKAGTKAMAPYPGEHPRVFFGDPKEPHVCNDDFANRPTTRLGDGLHLERRLGTCNGSGLATRVMRANTVARPPEPLPPGFEADLRSSFLGEDVLALAGRTGRDLTPWTGM